MGLRFRELSVNDFLNGIPGDAPSAETRKKFKEVDFSAVTTGRDWYPLMKQTTNSVFEACRSAKVVYLDTTTHKAPESPGMGSETKPTTIFKHAGIYLDTPEARSATSHDEKQLKDRKVSAEEPNAGCKAGSRSWHWVAIPVEFKHHPRKLAFVFNDPAKQRSCLPASPSQPAQDDHSPDVHPVNPSIEPFVQDSIEGERALSQFTEYMLNVVNHQHRVRCFSIYVWRYMARLCCFDRGAAIVSEEFRWITTDSPLHNFLWRVAHMSLEELGYDPTATIVDDDEAKPFKEMAEDEQVPEPVRKYVAAATAEGVPIYKIRIKPMAAPPDEGLPVDPSSKLDESPRADASLSTVDPSSSPPPVEPEERCFLVGKPHIASGLVGRCTRGYVAYDVSNKRLCFVKDCWRSYIPGRTRPEHLIHERLNSCNVRHIDTLICGGDVGGLRAQMTEFQYLLTHLQGVPVPRVHYRLATKEIGLPLEDFASFRHLAIIFYCAVKAHQDAWTKAKVLHRDISIGNILIDPVTKHGILIDWGLSCLEWELAPGPTAPAQTGTWPFRSALALNYPRKPSRLSDDLEGFIHVFRYLVLKYHPTHIVSLRQFVTSTFEVMSLICGVKVGGETKLFQFRSSDSPIEVMRNPVLQAVLDAFHRGCSESYMRIDLEMMKELYGIDNPLLDIVPGVRVGVKRTWPDSAFTEHRRANLVDKKNEREEAANDSGRSLAGKDISTKPVKSEVSDPCTVTGFLSCHQNLIDILLGKYANAKKCRDKQRDQFHYRSHVLCQDIQRFQIPRSLSTNDSSGSMSDTSDDTDLIPSNLDRSPSSSDAPTSGFTDLSVTHGKRARQECSDEAETGDPQGTSSSGTLYSRDDSDEDVNQAAAGEQDRRKRQRR